MNTIKSMFLSFGLMYACQMTPSAPASSSSSPFRANYQDQTFQEYDIQRQAARLQQDNANLEYRMTLLEQQNMKLQAENNVLFKKNYEHEECLEGYDKAMTQGHKIISGLQNLLQTKEQELNRYNRQTPSTPYASSASSIPSTRSTTPHTPRFSWSPNAQQASAAGLSEQEMQQRQQLLSQQYIPASQQTAAAGMSQEQMQQYQAQQSQMLRQQYIPASQQIAAARISQEQMQQYQNQLAVRTISPAQAQNRYNEPVNQGRQLNNNKSQRSESAPAPKMNNIPESEEE